MNVVFVTGNENKARYFSELIGRDIEYKKVDTPELQSLDLKEVVSEKAKAAYKIIGRPVIVEDTSLIIKSLGRLPGTFIKWFLEEVGLEKFCKLADVSSDRSAHASAAFAYFDGSNLQVFIGGLDGSISATPKGKSGFGWNQIFIPNGKTITLGEMPDAEFKEDYMKIKPFPAVKEFLDNLEA